MLAQFALDFDLSHWENWTTPAVGLSCTCLLLIVARMFLSGSKDAAAPAPGKARLSWEDPSTIPEIGERRAFIRRRGHAVSVSISNAGGDAEPFSGRVRNRSIGGLCLLVPRAVEANVILSIRTADADTKAPWVQVEVKWCRPRDDEWELGCKFVRTPPYCQLLLFG